MKSYFIAGAILTALVPGIAFAQFNTDLQYGSTGGDVGALQQFLTQQGVYSGPISGNFYSLTLAAVKKFQLGEGITPVSGYVGPITRKVINQILTAQMSSSESSTTAAGNNGTTTPTIQSLEQELNDITTRQNEEYQPQEPPHPQGTTIVLNQPSTGPVLPAQVTYAVLSPNGITLETTFPIDIRSFSLVAFDPYTVATTSVGLPTNIASSTATENQKTGTYFYGIIFSQPLTQIFANYYGLANVVFRLSFDTIFGIATSSQPFAFTPGLPTTIPVFHVTDAGNTVRVNF